MKHHAETPVTIGCDFPACGEVDMTMALAFDRPDDITDVRARARAAAIEIATGKGWRVRPDGVALCPAHAHPVVVLP